MTPDWWQRVSELFNAALPLKDAQRQELLDTQCGSDLQLRNEVERLLARDAEAESDDFLSPPLETTRDGLMFSMPRSLKVHCPSCGNGIELVDFMSVQQVECPTCHSNVTIPFPESRAWSILPETNRIARFLLEEQVGTGAFGTVYRAYDPDLQRDVAVKLLRVGPFAGNGQLARFMEEARSAAQLQNKGIVRVFDAGEYEGIPYIVSDFIAGVTLAESLKLRRPAFPEAARLAAEVAEALEYAHQHGVIHRDVKAQNIMIGHDGQAHLMDFGLAKREASDIVITVEGQILGTPAYMPPEQARGELSKVDRRSDVYSLGVVIYQMITGELPFRGTTRMLLHQVLQDEPRPPRELNDRIPRDLETICLKAMAKEPQRRYATAAELHQDLRRFLDGKPIVARPASFIERAWRWSRRNPALATAIGATTISLLGVSVLSFLLAMYRNRTFVESSRHLALVNYDLGRAACERGEVGAGLHWLSRSSRAASSAGDPSLVRLARENLLAWQGQNPRLLGVFSHDSAVKAAVFSPDGKMILTTSADHTARLWDAATVSVIGPVLPHQGVVCFGAFSPDGKIALTTSLNGEARLWETGTGKLLHDLAGHRGGVFNGVFSRDGKRLVTSSEDRKARIWDVVAGRLLHELAGHEGPVQLVALGPDDQTVMTASEDGTARLWNAATGLQTGPPLRHEAEVESVNFSPDGKTALTASFDHTARLWDVATGRLLHKLVHDDEVWAAIFSPDGQTVATASADHTARLWNVATGRPRWAPLAHDGRAQKLAFSPDGKLLATGSWDHTARLWNVATGEPLGLRLRHESRVLSVAFSPDGRTILTASADRTARLWDAGTVKPLYRDLALPGQISLGMLSPDGKQALLGARDGSLLRCDAATGETIDAPLSLGDPVSAIAWSPDGKIIAAGGASGKTRLWNLAGGPPVDPAAGFPARVCAAAFSPDSHTVLFGSVDGSARLVAAATGQIRGEPLIHEKSIYASAFSPDGTLVATASFDHMVKIWDSGTGRMKLGPLVHPDKLLSVAFSPDGKTLLTGCIDNNARLWSTATGKTLGRPLQCDGEVFAAAFHPEGKMIVTGSVDGKARIWDVASGTAIGPPMVHQSVVSAVAFSRDGHLIATASFDGTARLWDSLTGRPIGPPLRHPRKPDGEPYEVQGISLSPDAGRAVTFGEDRIARLWDIASFTRGPAPLSSRIEALTGLTLDDDGVIHVLDTATWNARREPIDTPNPR